MYSDIVQLLICTVENMFAVRSVCPRKTVTHSIFIDKFIDYSSWIINLLLDGLVCTIALYFY